MLDVGAKKPPRGKWSTPPFDPRFPNQNQTRNCYQNFLDFHRCVKTMKRRGKSEQPCDALELLLSLTTELVFAGCCTKSTFR
uniref:Cytochrome c oxidase subunit 6B2 n=1 Tax=Propithecus coquereli TaxID=379532 RepID=A0A2K6G387_PROCO